MYKQEERRSGKEHNRCRNHRAGHCTDVPAPFGVFYGSQRDLLLIGQAGITDADVQFAGTPHGPFMFRIRHIRNSRRAFGKDNHFVNLDFLYHFKRNFLTDPCIC
jgi:hypothetical protein